MIPATDISLRRLREPDGSSGRRAGWGWLLLCILLAGGFLFKAFSAASPSPDRSHSASVSATASLADSGAYQTVSIEDLAEGDTVLARDPLTGRVQEKRVTRVYRRVSDHLRVLNIRGPDGTSRELKTTDEHPFWVVDERGFEPAGQLQSGDRFIGPAGELQTLVSSCREEHPRGTPVYNIETEGYHTYFVAAHGTRAPPALVHNCGAPKNPAEAFEEGLSVRRGVDIGIHRPPRHHIFPQEHRAFFAERGFTDIDNYTIPLDRATHDAIHKWMGSGPWNDVIVERVLAREAELGRMLTRREIMQIGAQMRREAGLQHIKIILFLD
jgi:hypothetical protein